MKKNTRRAYRYVYIRENDSNRLEPIRLAYSTLAATQFFNNEYCF